MRSFYADGISDFGTSANTMFREGALAMYCFTNGPIVSEGFISDAELEGKWTVGAIGESGYLGGHAICGNAATEKAANAVEFIKWFTSPEQQPLWMTEKYGIQPINVDS
jgi:ABC-type glycerol-3-phosphate transport system substrate-binding protein